MNYYTYDMVNGTFDYEKQGGRVVDPTHTLHYVSFPIYCWTDFDKAKAAVAGLLQAKVERLTVIIDHTNGEIQRLEEVSACDDCGDVVDDEDLFVEEVMRHEFFLCEQCAINRQAREQG